MPDIFLLIFVVFFILKVENINHLQNQHNRTQGFKREVSRELKKIRRHKPLLACLTRSEGPITSKVLLGSLVAELGTSLTRNETENPEVSLKVRSLFYVRIFSNYSCSFC